MSSYSRFGRYFSGFGISGISGIAGVLGINGINNILLSTATLTTPTADNNPYDTHITTLDTGHPHLTSTTTKQEVHDPMHDHPKVMKSSREWPRVEIDQHHPLSAMEISAIQKELQKELDNNNNSINNTKHSKKKETKSSNNNNNMENNIDDNSIINEYEMLLLEQAEMCKYIDHTQLKPFATKTDIELLCNEAMAYNFKSVCVNPVYVSYAANLLKNSNVKVCCVVGFPLGANDTKIKVLEALQAVHDGAQEIDMVISISMVKSQDWDAVELDIASVVQAVQTDEEDNGNNNNNNNNNKKVLVKVILETSMLTKEEIIKSCEICVRSGANYVKTSTGFGGGGATIENVKLMKDTIKNELKRRNRKTNEVKVKASGGVRNFQSAKEMIKAGASRLGTSSSLHIIGKDEKQKRNFY